MMNPETLQKTLTLSFAERYVTKKKSVIPLNGKRPAVDWKQFQTSLPTEEDLQTWFAEERNIGIVTGKISSITVVDCDTREDAIWWYREFPETVMAKTGRGVHFYYSYAPIGNKAGVLGRKIDIRGDGGYVVAPPSSHENGAQYEWICGEMAIFNPAWVGESETVSTESRRIRDGMKYIADIRAVGGNNGHNATFRAACRLTESGMSETEVFAALLDWNQTNCEPPWTHKELLHKAQEAYRVTLNKMLSQQAAADCAQGGCDLGGSMR